MGLIKRVKNSNKPLFGQILDLIPSHIISESVDEYQSDRYIKSYTTKTQLTAMLFGQLNDCQTLRDIVAGFNVSAEFLGDIGLQKSPARSTMSDGHAKRDWRVYESIFNKVITHYKRLFSRTASNNDIKVLTGKAVKIVDSSTVSLCLNLFPWAKFRQKKGAIKIHTKLEYHDDLPDLVHLSDGKMHDKKAVPHLQIKDHSVLIDDRAYYDFSAFVDFIDRSVTFVTRIKENADYKVMEDCKLSPEDEQAGIKWSRIIQMRGNKAFETTLCDHNLRIVGSWNEAEGKVVEILTNNMDWPPNVVGQVYRKRWKIETFFKGLKQNLQVKTFIGTNENAVKSQIYIALLAYVLMEFIRKHMSTISHAQKQFFNLIRICLNHYQGLKYVISGIPLITLSIDKRSPQHNGQLSLFSTI
jgi:hypothetical protein